ncbi:YbaY family lipoprotein [Motilimonas sp. 1_MG-2023]|uniref:YbaY family lipoprotein n=1 Tax=Motilimonas sp. 1_MG-2023 TaxID=3062672 RepID=UPI0026E4546D|nr:YbaY family lipoprotein [Motilimonas sp. 1_MG-2023]MDO6525746.1 YbaY family lipoprotein [Motilimonas sp. 1_MG-2023]
MKVLLITFFSMVFLVACNESNDNATVKDPNVYGVIELNGLIEFNDILRMEVQIIDYSIGDASAVIVGKTEIELIDSFPLSYKVSYKAEDINEGNLYSVRASLISVRDSGEEFAKFITTQAYPVLTNGASSEVDLLLEPIE